MPRVMTNPNDKQDTNEANLQRVWEDSRIEEQIRIELAERIKSGENRVISVIQLDMDKSVEIRRHGIGVKIAVLSEVGKLLKCKEGQNCRVILHGTRDDVTILRWGPISQQTEECFLSHLLAEIASARFGAETGFGPFAITYSAGLALYPIHGRESVKLLELADSAVRKAKKLGKGRFAFAEFDYNCLQTGKMDAYRWERLTALSIASGKPIQELLREGYELLFQKHAALYRFCEQEKQ